MDLALYTRVLWRFRVLVLLGFILACVLSFLSYARVSFAGGSPKISYRESETWASKTRLLITEPGFQIGKLSLASPYPSSTTASTSPVASPQSLASLAQSYVELGNSDAVQALLMRDHTVHGTMTVTPEYAGQNNSVTLPVVDVNGLGPTAADAAHTAQRGTAVFVAYFKQQQRLNGVPPKNRVELELLNKATPTAAQILVKRKKTLPIVVFVAVMTAALGLAFILENLRPRIRAVPEEPGDELRPRKQASA